MHQNFKNFVDGLLQYQPEKRLGMQGWAELKGHPYFTAVNFDWQALEARRMESPLRGLVEKDEQLGKCMMSRRLTKEPVAGGETEEAGSI